MADFSKLFVLVVDDNEPMQRIVHTILEAFGVTRVIYATDADQAVGILETEPVDIVICDEIMPNMTGSEFCRAVRTSDKINPHLPIIILTAFANRNNVIKARDAGATEFCAKPVSIQTLFNRIAAVIDRPRPFVRATSFVGPDRRRSLGPTSNGLTRRESDNG
ncbi:response regulator [Hyphobacterium sp. HN65]|uniref:Response regulator n=1 Tax=Hyphobacterium lacteum TaxID=3116575 RepID=A0ABU7LQF0_9PROT|nr:response regulator [Hyphobacterium sp. HN65]MEE2525819.1 response regulator [Hyphobacterium sp. HN65]